LHLEAFLRIIQENEGVHAQILWIPGVWRPTIQQGK